MITADFDYREDANGKDPDTSSPSLRRHHSLLWSKELPSGAKFDLDATQGTNFYYLRHTSELGDFRLASDSAIPTYSTWQKPAWIHELVQSVPSSERESFQKLGYTIGGMIVFPKGVGRVHTVNQTKGVKAAIRDRFDLTIECIRLHYAGEESPLSKTLTTYADFFALFQSFDGYIEYFLLQDMVEDGRVRFFKDQTSFDDEAAPTSLDEYREYRERAMEFLDARNKRIVDWANENLPDEQARKD